MISGRTEVNQFAKNRVVILEMELNNDHWNELPPISIKVAFSFC